MPAGRSTLLRILIGVVLLTGVVAVVRKPIKRAFFDKVKTVSTGRFVDPEGMAVDREGNFYIADEDTGLFYMLDKDGKILAQAKSLPGVEHLTTGDSMIVIEPRHLVIIGFHCLLEIKIVGDKIELVRQISKRGHGDGEFEDPEGISIDRATGEIYATDEDHQRVLVFNREGKHVRTIPMGADPEAICVFEDRIYVTMSKAGWVGCYSKKDGKLMFKFGSSELNEPDYAAVSPDRKLYITDQRANCIKVFDLDGKFLFTIGKFGRGPGEFDQPEDLAFDAEGNLIVADGDNHRIQVLTKDGKPLRIIE